jgi:hypothetical protein
MKHIWVVEEAWSGGAAYAYFTDAESAEEYRAHMVADGRVAEDDLRVVRVELNPTWEN